MKWRKFVDNQTDRQTEILKTEATLSPVDRRGERANIIGIILARSPDDPQRIRVASVFEFSVLCLSVCSLWANFLIFCF